MLSVVPIVFIVTALAAPPARAQRDVTPEPAPDAAPINPEPPLAFIQLPDPREPGQESALVLVAAAVPVMVALLAVPVLAVASAGLGVFILANWTQEGFLNFSVAILLGAAAGFILLTAAPTSGAVVSVVPFLVRNGMARDRPVSARAISVLTGLASVLAALVALASVATLGVYGFIASLWLFVFLPGPAGLVTLVPMLALAAGALLGAPLIPVAAYLVGRWAAPFLQARLASKEEPGVGDDAPVRPDEALPDVAE